MKTKKPPRLENLGSLITYRDGGEDRCLGNLFHSPEHGTYDPTLGRVDVTKEQADAHNKLLDEALVAGLDAQCQVGQGGNFYKHEKGGLVEVRTWTGIAVTTAPVRPRGRVVEFTRGDRTFRGSLRRRDDCIFVERIA